jgi:uncharacterized coiled-coil protein SlyX
MNQNQIIQEDTVHNTIASLTMTYTQLLQSLGSRLREESLARLALEDQVKELTNQLDKLKADTLAATAMEKTPAEDPHNV